MNTTGISRRAFLRLSAVATAGLTLGACTQPGVLSDWAARAADSARVNKSAHTNMAADKPNILLILADDLGMDALHINESTGVVSVQIQGTDAYPLPNLGRVLAKGIHFTKAWTYPICAPSRASLFTGLHAWRSGVGDVSVNNTLPTKLPSDGVTELKTLANSLSAAGYQCGLFGKWHLGEDQAHAPTGRGWQRHDGILGGGLGGRDRIPPVKYTEAEAKKRYYDWKKDFSDAHTGAWLTEIPAEDRTYQYATADQVFSARDWIKQMQGTPWWVTLSLFAPHDPYHIPPEGTYTIQFKDPAEPTEQEMFVAMTEALDYYLGQFFADPSPEFQKRLKNTVILFLGDNGTDDTLDGVKGDDKGSVYTGGVHVPLVIADGGAIFGDGPCYLDASLLNTRQDHMVHEVDLFQTMLDIAGEPATSVGYLTDSISLTPHLKDTANDQNFTNWEARAYNFSQVFASPKDPERFKQLGVRATISDGNYKLNYQNGKYEFVELTFDPAAGIFAENVTDDFQHPSALSLWQTLTTPEGRYYAEADGQGQKFPPLTA